MASKDHILYILNHNGLSARTGMSLGYIRPQMKEFATSGRLFLKTDPETVFCTQCEALVIFLFPGMNV